jgi:dihydroorotate dehydrogenase
VSHSKTLYAKYTENIINLPLLDNLNRVQIMTTKSLNAFYNPAKTYDDNFDDGPEDVSVNPGVYVNKGEPRFTFLGFKLYSPFGIPAGPLLNSSYVKYAFDKGFDVLCYKTQRSVEFECNEFPNVLYLDVDGDLTLEKAATPQVGHTTTTRTKKDLSITNSFGNPSRGPDYWIDDLKKAITYQKEGQLLIMSVVGTIKEGFSSDDYFDDFANTALMAVEAGAKVVEVNLSCPNVANEGILCYSREAVKSVCEKTKNKIGGVPLIAKFGYFSDEQSELLANIIEDNKDFLAAVSVINTISAPIVDDKGNQALPGPNRLKSGVCGASIKWAGVDMVKKLDKLRKENNYTYEIIGVGGVMDVDDFREYREAGANVVMSATGAMWNPDLAIEVKASL